MVSQRELEHNVINESVTAATSTITVKRELVNKTVKGNVWSKRN